MKRTLIEGFILALIISSISFAGEHGRHREGYQFPEYRYRSYGDNRHHDSNHDDNRHDNGKGC